MGQPLVTIEKLTKVFAHEENDVVVLKGIDLSIEPAEMLCVVGPSGAGKSTLLHLLGTLDLPTSGRILYGGKDVTKYTSARLAEFRNRSIGFVFQFHHLLPEFSALENVMMPGMIRGEATSSVRQRAQALLEEVGLAHRVTHRPGELSGGEQQRVALARALVMHPLLILADEPTGNLDSKTSDAMHELFFRLNESRGTTFLIVTHSRDLAGRMPRVVRMSDGMIEEDFRRGEATAAIATDVGLEQGTATVEGQARGGPAEPAPPDAPTAAQDDENPADLADSDGAGA